MLVFYPRRVVKVKLLYLSPDPLPLSTLWVLGVEVCMCVREEGGVQWVPFNTHILVKHKKWVIKKR